MGRPRVEDQNKRIIQVNIRLTEDEYKTVTQYSQASGIKSRKLDAQKTIHWKIPSSKTIAIRSLNV